MSIDVDDVGALCVAHALVANGEADILSIVHNTGLLEGAAAIGVINHYFGADSVPIGAYDGPVGARNHTPSNALLDWTNRGEGWYVRELVERFPPRSGPRPAADASSLSVLRGTLERADNHSVTLAAIGHATNLAELLTSPGGKLLVEQKVKEAIWMGGGRAGGEWNLVGPSVGCDPDECGAYALLGNLTRKAVNAWPSSIPLIFLPFESGVDVHSGGSLATQHVPEDISPCRAAYELFCGTTGGSGGLPFWCDEHGRAAWDLQAILYAVRAATGLTQWPNRAALATSSVVGRWCTLLTDPYACGPWCVLQVRGPESHYVLENGRMFFGVDGAYTWQPATPALSSHELLNQFMAFLDPVRPRVTTRSQASTCVSSSTSIYLRVPRATDGDTEHRG